MQLVYAMFAHKDDYIPLFLLNWILEAKVIN